MTWVRKESIPNPSPGTLVQWGDDGGPQTQWLCMGENLIEMRWDACKVREYFKGWNPPSFILLGEEWI